MTIRDIVVAFGFEVDQSSVSKAENSINGLKKMASRLLGAIGIGFSIRGLSELAEAAADVDALNSQFSQVFGEMEDNASKSLDSIAADTGVFANRMKSSFTQLAAFTKTTGADEAQALEIADRGMKAATDSAAFYDRSIEQVTASLQSFLKGNYENDAALGLSCTETTRNTAANKLFGKSFKDLSEYQKQLALIQMVEDANKASGALGQAARESDTWVNQLGNLKQALKDLKSSAGSSFLKPAVGALKMLTGLVQKATVVVKKFTGENGYLTRITERYHALVKRLQPSIDRMTATFSKGWKNGIDVVRNVVDKLGGVENAMRLVALVATSFLLVMNWGKIITGAKMFIKMLTGIRSIFSAANMKIMGITALVVILGLVIEDFINFLLGNDSIIGTFFDNIGIGADNARQAIFEAFGKASDFIREHIDIVKALAVAYGTFKLGSLTAQLARMTKLMALATAAKIKDKAETLILKALYAKDFLTSIVKTTASLAKQAVQFGLNTAAKFANAVAQGALTAATLAWNVAAGIASTVTTALGAAFAFLTSPIGLVILAIAGLIAIGVLLYKNWDSIKEYASSLWEGISSTIGNIKDGIINGLTEAINFITSLPEKALQWGADFINGLKQGIENGIEGVVNAVKNVGNKIRSFLHFSVPDEGPLTDYESWMPDFMGGLAQGISDNESVLLDKVKSVAESIRTLMTAATANLNTANTSTVNNSTSSVTQNVNIANSYTGGSMETQKNVSKAMKKSAVDATTQMARSLAYARG